jgi:predicted MFS family arabinose efflux permease
MAAVARHEKSTLPPVVALLALGTFLMCTTGFMIAGLLASPSSSCRSCSSASASVR